MRIAGICVARLFDVSEECIAWPVGEKSVEAGTKGDDSQGP